MFGVEWPPVAAAGWPPTAGSGPHAFLAVLLIFAVVHCCVPLQFEEVDIENATAGELEEYRRHLSRQLRRVADVVDKANTAKKVRRIAASPLSASLPNRETAYFLERINLLTRAQNKNLIASGEITEAPDASSEVLETISTTAASSVSSTTVADVTTTSTTSAETTTTVNTTTQSLPVTATTANSSNSTGTPPPGSTSSPAPSSTTSSPTTQSTTSSISSTTPAVASSTAEPSAVNSSTVPTSTTPGGTTTPVEAEPSSVPSMSPNVSSAIDERPLTIVTTKVTTTVPPLTTTTTERTTQSTTAQHTTRQTTTTAAEPTTTARTVDTTSFNPSFNHTPEECRHLSQQELVRELKQKGTYNPDLMAWDVLGVIRFLDRTITDQYETQLKNRTRSEEVTERNVEALARILSELDMECDVRSAGIRAKLHNLTMAEPRRSIVSPSLRKRNKRNADALVKDLEKAHIGVPGTTTGNASTTTSTTPPTTTSSALKHPIYETIGKKQKLIGESRVVPFGCDRRGTEEDGYLRLCSACQAIRRLPDTFFPPFINEVTCDEDNACLYFYDYPHGRCRQKHMNFVVLRNVGTPECQIWKKFNLNVRVSCECFVDEMSFFAKYV